MKITLDSIISGFKSVTKLIANFDLIESELNDKVLYRDNPNGEPNQMENDLDMNGNRITNLPTATNNTDPVTYGQFQASASVVQFTGTVVNSQLGSDAAGSTFTVSEYTPGSSNLQVYLNGVLAPVSTYTEPTSTTVVMNTAPVSDDEYTFIINSRQVDTATVPASSVTYTPTGGAATNADAHLKTVDTKLQEVVNVKEFGAVGDGVTDDTAAFQAACDAAESLSRPLIISGTVRITAPVTLSGIDARLEGEIKVDGTDPLTFASGGVVLASGSTLTGGVVYTSGTMTSTASGYVVSQLDGSLVDVTVYSQLHGCVYHTRGDITAKLVGGQTRGIRSELTVDEPTVFNITYYNIGVAYTDKAIRAPLTLPSDSRAVHIIANGDIYSSIIVEVHGFYSWKNGAWLGKTVQGTFHNLKTIGHISKAGYYWDGSAEQLGSGAGTAWEIENCPTATLTASSKMVRGYNIAIVTGSHYAVDTGTHEGIGGDPCAVVVTSNNVTFAGVYSKGTVGVSVGEDGAQADNTLITGTIIDSANEPVRVSAAKNTRLIGTNIIGEPTSTSTTGSWAGIGQLRPVIVALHEEYGAQDIVIRGCAFQGYFTHEVLEQGHSNVGAANTLRVHTDNNTYGCPIIPRDNQNHFNTIGADLDGTTKFTRIDTSSLTDGYANVGEVTMADGVALTLLTINTAFSDLTVFQSGTETLAEALSGYDVLFYLKYRTSFIRDSSRILRFGLTTSGNASHVGDNLYSVFVAYEAILGRPLKDNEWIPMRLNMDDLLYDSADPANINYFMMSADDITRGYDYVITTPVVVPVGDIERS